MIGILFPFEETETFSQGFLLCNVHSQLRRRRIKEQKNVKKKGKETPQCSRKYKKKTIECYNL